MTQARIQILPPHVVNRIAAGEVVERPASVVKELVENALDAGATKIEIFAAAGGRSLRVADNGHGMSPENARLAFYNHATSKITEESDLSRIQTLGFRGEALASICSIARVVCHTRTADADAGTKVTFTDLGEPVLSTVGCAPGTVLEVSDLFFNTPARLKFLKRPQTELTHIEEVVQYLALSHPEIQFSLHLNEKNILKTRGTGELKSTLEEVFRLNRKEVQDLLSVTQEDTGNGLTLAGYMSPPGMLKSSKRWLVTFVNERSVRCPVFAKAVESAYASLIPSDKYPLCALFLSISPEDVDVNVHPTKKEVRYVSPNAIFGFVRHSLQTTLELHGHQAYQAAVFGAAPLSPVLENTAQPTQLSHFSNPLHTGRSAWGPLTPPAAVGMPRSTGESNAALSFYAPAVSEASGAGERLPDLPADQPWRVIGQLFNTYILLETRQGLMVVDQHIASERTFFEALTRNTFAQEPDVQKLMAVTRLEVSLHQLDLLRDNQDAFSSLGFSYTLDPEAQAISLTSLPILYQERQPKGLFESLLTQLEETGQMQLKLEDMIATLACHSAVRAGDPLTPAEMQQVISRWLACSLPWTCPHGRPIAHTIQTSELNHFFHRPSLPVNA